MSLLIRTTDTRVQIQHLVVGNALEVAIVHVARDVGPKGQGELRLQEADLSTRSM